jgi:hypothetical protein
MKPLRKFDFKTDLSHVNLAPDTGQFCSQFESLQYRNADSWPKYEIDNRDMYLMKTIIAEGINDHQQTNIGRCWWKVDVNSF